MVAIVFMVAGLSSRFKSGPKQMAKIGPNNETLIEYSVNQSLKNGKFSKIYFITNYKTEHFPKYIFLISAGNTWLFSKSKLSFGPYRFVGITDR